MVRPFVTRSFVAALALVPVALFAQNPPAQQPPAQPPAQTPAAPAQPAAPKMAIKGTAGVSLVHIKPDQTAPFEELIVKLKTGLASASDPELKQQASMKVYKAAEPMGGNVLYIVLVAPAVANAEYA